jgi:hypothetical protein
MQIYYNLRIGENELAKALPRKGKQETPLYWFSGNLRSLKTFSDVN